MVNSTARKKKAKNKLFKVLTRIKHKIYIYIKIEIQITVRRQNATATVSTNYFSSILLIISDKKSDAKTEEF